jgi:polyhydroxybutyrate depolymerase|tara:strand:+ start:1800 stop:2852 length:1053 start_codon:yes stop_codon:yes gene_type:complete
MRYLSLVFATLLLVGCIQSSEPQMVPDEVDVQLPPSPDQEVERMEEPEQIDDQPEPIQEPTAEEELGQSVTSPTKEAELPRGLIDMSFAHGGEIRESLLYVPDSYNPSMGAPLMLSFHGFGLDSQSQLKQADMRSLADRDGILLAYPQGTLLGRFPHWNALPNSPENKSAVDDLGFVRELISQIESDYPINRERIYASGFSNGGMMAYALACYEKDLVAAVAVVSGQLLDNGETCSPESSIGVIMLHGTDDRVIPYEGAFGQLSAQEAVDFWVEHNETNISPQIDIFVDGEMTIERHFYDQGNNGVAVEHYKYLEGQHVWFNQRVEGANASELIWNFVSDYDLGGIRNVS